MITVDKDRCIGCSACSNVCPNKNITREDSPVRTIRWASCNQECDLCVEFCPQKALKLVPECDETVLTFSMMPCRICGRSFATQSMVMRVLSAIPQRLQCDSSGQVWIGTCPECLREMERDRSVSDVVCSRM